MQSRAAWHNLYVSEVEALLKHRRKAEITHPASRLGRLTMIGINCVGFSSIRSNEPQDDTTDKAALLENFRLHRRVEVGKGADAYLVESTVSIAAQQGNKSLVVPVFNSLVSPYLQRRYLQAFRVLGHEGVIIKEANTEESTGQVEYITRPDSTLDLVGQELDKKPLFTYPEIFSDEHIYPPYILIVKL